MKTDLYTKAVLTVIAISLTIIAFKEFDFIPNAHAEANDGLKVGINYGLVPINKDGSIDVNVKSSSTMDVNIESCSSYAFKYAGPMKVIVSENQDK